MKKSMNFHFLFSMWVTLLTLSGLLFILRIPSYLISIIEASQRLNPDTSFLWASLVTSIIYGVYVIVGTPLLINLWRRKNLSLNQIKLFFITLLICRYVLKQVTIATNPTMYASEFTWMSFLPYALLVLLILKVILNYYRQRLHLFTV